MPRRLSSSRRRLLGLLAGAVVAVVTVVGLGDGDTAEDLATGATSTTSTTTAPPEPSTTTAAEGPTTSPEPTTPTGPASTAPSAPESPAPLPPSSSGPPRPPSGSAFADLVVAGFRQRGIDPAAACNVTNAGVRRVFEEYGAVFVASGVTPPSACIFADHAATAAFQSRVDAATATVGGVSVTLQRPALEALQAAVADANAVGAAVTPRGSAASSRSFATTEQFWRSRVDPGLDRYVSEGRISGAYAGAVRGMANLDQIAAILDLEAQGMLFGRNQHGSIMASVAPPGSSQHLSLLALDVEQYGSPAVQAALADHGWFRTIADDEPHFTYLGRPESNLRGLGLTPVDRDGQRFWVPAT